MFKGARDLTPSDSVRTDFQWLMVTTTAGTVVMDTEGGDEITLAAMPVGVWTPVGRMSRVKTASTAVGFMVA